MAEIVSTVTSKGQVTIPAEVRRHLRVGQNDKIIFVIEPDGEVRIKVPKYPSIRSMAGVLATLPGDLARKKLSKHEMLEIAYEEREEARQTREDA